MKLGYLGRPYPLGTSEGHRQTRIDLTMDFTNSCHRRFFSRSPDRLVLSPIVSNSQLLRACAVRRLFNHAGSWKRAARRGSYLLGG